MLGSTALELTACRGSLSQDKAHGCLSRQPAQRSRLCWQRFTVLASWFRALGCLSRLKVRTILKQDWSQACSVCWQSSHMSMRALVRGLLRR